MNFRWLFADIYSRFLILFCIFHTDSSKFFHTAKAAENIFFQCSQEWDFLGEVSKIFSWKYKKVIFHGRKCWGFQFFVSIRCLYRNEKRTNYYSSYLFSRDAVICLRIDHLLVNLWKFYRRVCRQSVTLRSFRDCKTKVLKYESQ